MLGRIQGMLVLHTTISEVYERLWVAHEADVGIDSKIQMRGLFDMYRWTVERFEKASAVKTSEGKCGVVKDRAYIDGLIKQRGGYERLDDVIGQFRTRMLGDLRKLMEVDQNSEPFRTGGHTRQMNLGKTVRMYDWVWQNEVIEFMSSDDGDDEHRLKVFWEFDGKPWPASQGPLGLDSYPFIESTQERLTKYDPGWKDGTGPSGPFRKKNIK